MSTAASKQETLTEVLGIAATGAPHGDLALIALLKTGLPQQSLTRVAERIAPDQKDFRFRLVPRATLARRKKDDARGMLSAEQGARVVRLA